MKTIRYTLCLLLVMMSAALTAAPIAESWEEYTICTGDSIVADYGDTHIVLRNDTTLYIHYPVANLLTGEVRDSVHAVIVHTAPKYFIHETHYLHEGESLSWRGMTYSQTGTYRYPYISAQGCDSVYILHLNVGTAVLMDTTAEVCQSELPFMWHGDGYTASGTYQKYFTNKNGIDSVYQLNLIVHEIAFEELHFNLCKGDSITFNGKKYYQGGIYQDADECTRAYRIVITEYIPHEYYTKAWMHADQTYYWKYGRNNELQKTFDQPGVYSERVVNPESGCYDVYKLELLRGNTFYSEEFYTICEGEPFVWHNRDLSHAGVGKTTIYYDSLKTTLGNDSVYKLTLTVGKKGFTTQNLVVCKGGSIVWNGKTYTQGVYEDTLQTTLGCDSIIRTIVTEANSYYIEQDITLPAGESMHWHGIYITKAGDYYYYGRTQAGCDSTLVLHVSVTPAPQETWLMTDEVSICQGVEYEWRGRHFSTTGIYYDSLTCQAPAQLGRDSVYMLKLTVWPTYQEVKHLYSCNEGTIRYNGVNYTEADAAGPIQVTLQSIHGCDSIITLYLHFNAMFEQYDTLHFSNQDSHIWQGQAIITSGDYTARYDGKNGCDSIYHLHAIVDNIFINETDTAICETEAPFQWHDLTIPRRVGTYSYEWREKIMDGDTEKDITHILHVTQWPVYEVNQQINICEGSQITYYGQVFDQPGDFDILIKNEGNCDSLIHVHVNIFPEYHSVTEAYINTYKKGTYTWMGTVYNEPGTYIIQNQNEFGCEQIHELLLRELPLRQDTQVVCANELPYIWRGHAYEYTPGHAYDLEDFARDENNVDTAMYTLHLEILPAHELHLRKDLCLGESAYIGDQEYTASTPDVIEALKSVDGCDSIIHWELVFHEPFHSTETRYLRPGKSFEWHDMLITEPGFYTDQHENIWKCDSTYDLRVLPLKVIGTAATICVTDTPYIWSYNGEKYYESTEDYRVEQDQYGLDSAEYSLQLTVLEPFDTLIVAKICSNQLPYRLTIPGHVFEHDTTGIYHDTIPGSEYGGCDSIYHIHLNVFPAVQTYLDTTICETMLPFRVADQLFWNEGEYFIETKTVACDCDSLVDLRLHIRPTMTHNDSIVLCNSALPYYLGDTAMVRALHPESEYHGLPFYSDTIVWDCDHSYFFKIEVRDPVQLLDYYLCQGDSVQFGKNADGSARWIFDSGVYDDTIPTHEHTIHAPNRVFCDSIHRLNVYLLPRDTIRKTVHILSGEEYDFYGKKLAMTNTYYAVDTATMDAEGIDISKRRCQDIIELRLIVDTIYHFRDSIHVCLPIDSFIYHQWPGGHWQGDDGINGPDGQPKRLKIAHSGIYTDSLRRTATRLSTDNYYKNFKDSIYTLVVTMDTAYIAYRSYGLCEGDSVLFADQWIHQAGIYRDTLTSIKGCDSIIQLVVNTLPTYHIRLQDVLISDKMLPYQWHVTHEEGDVVHTLYKSGLYHDTLPTEQGCRQIISLQLNVAPSYQFYDTVHVCQTYIGEERQFTFRHEDGRSHTMHFRFSGDYADSLYTVGADQTQQGWWADSTYYLHVETHIMPRTRKDTTICRGDSLMFNGQYIRTEGLHYDTIRTMPHDSRDTCHCDSIIEWNIRLAELFYVDEGTRYIAHGGSYLWHWNGADTLLTTEGVYYDKLSSQFGCDSTYRIQIVYAPTYEIVERDEVCLGVQPYRWHNTDLYSTGTYYDSLHTTLGFDSVYVLHLTVHNIGYGEYHAQICTGDYGIDYNGKHYGKQGTYIDTLTTRDGCDSIVSVHVHEMPTYFYSDTVAINSHAGGYQWQNETYTHSGTFRKEYSTQEGCDSIYELVLTIHAAEYVRDTIVTRCESELPFVWRGQSYSENAEIHDTLSGVEVDTIYNIQFQVFRIGRHVIEETICQGEQFYLNDKPYSQPGRHNDTIHGGSHSGCDSIVTLILHTITPVVHHEEAHISDRDSYLWKPYEGATERRLSHEGLFRDTIRSGRGCDSIYYEILLHVWPTYLQDTTITICREDAPLIFGNRSFDQSGDYYDTLQTVMHYDSIWSIHLTILEMERIVEERHLCEGDSFFFHNHWIAQDTFYYDTIPSSIGCGKIYNVRVSYRHPQHILLTDKTASGTPYYWKPTTDATYRFISTGTYEHIIRTADDLCDSVIYTLNLKVCPTYKFSLDTMVCSNDLPYQWHGRPLDEDGIYYDSLQTVDGFDSIFTINFRTLPQYFSMQNVDLCQGSSSFVFRGKTYSEAGVFFDTIPTIGGCDSIFKITVRVHPNYERFDTVHISDKETYNFNGRDVSVPGIYHAYLKSLSGCDSIVHLFLVVHPTYRIKITQDICNKDTFYFGERMRPLTESGIYYDSLLTRKPGDEGYDSITILTLNVWPTYYKDESYTLCPGDHLWIRGRDVSEPGEYWDTLYTVHGCDSVIHFVVNVKRATQIDYNYTICDGDSVLFEDGKWYKMAGDYYYHSNERCDLVQHMHLVVHPAFYHDTTILLTPYDFPYIYNNKQYVDSGTYVYPMKTYLGCDSIRTVHLVKTDRFSIEPERIALCDGNSVRINNQNITKPGLYRFYYRSNPKGPLDSIRIVEVFEATSFVSNRVDSLVICQGDTAMYCGMPFTRAGNHTVRLTTQDGCDSIFYMHLTIHPVYVMPPVVITTSDMQPYKWHNRYYDVTGIYTDTLTTVNGCDSIESLKLNVVQSIHYEEQIEICMGDSFVWRAIRDTVLRTPGLYVQVLNNNNSYYSYTVLLTVRTPVTLRSATANSVCADAPNFDIDLNYIYNGDGTPESYSVYFDAVGKRAGLQDVIDAPFPGGNIITVDLPVSTDSLYHDGKQPRNSYITPGEYTMQVQLLNGACQSQVITTTLHILYPAWIMQQNWQDVVAVLDSYHNGGYEFRNFYWTLNGNPLTNATPYLYYPGGFTVGDKVGLSLTRYSGEQPIEVCEPLTIVRHYNNDPDAHPYLTPTIVPKSAPTLRLKAKHHGTYRIIDLHGNVADKGSYDDGEQMITLPGIGGCYIIWMQSSNGSVWTDKVMVY